MKLERTLSHIDTFFSQFESFHIHKGKMIISSCESTDFVFYIVKGIVKQSFISDDGEEIILTLLKAGAYFPKSFILQNTETDYDYTALTSACIIKKTTKESFMQFLQSDLTALIEVCKQYALCTKECSAKVADTMFTDSYGKVVALLLYLAESFGHVDNDFILIPVLLTHTELNALIGISRETVSRQIELLKKQGFIANKGDFLVVFDLKKLKKQKSKRTRIKAFRTRKK